MKKTRGMVFLPHMALRVRCERNFQKMHNEGYMGMSLKPIFANFPIASCSRMIKKIQIATE
jgi:hypothetical protein